MATFKGCSEVHSTFAIQTMPDNARHGGARWARREGAQRMSSPSGANKDTREHYTKPRPHIWAPSGQERSQVQIRKAACPSESQTPPATVTLAGIICPLWSRAESPNKSHASEKCERDVSFLANRSFGAPDSRNDRPIDHT